MEKHDIAIFFLPATYNAILKYTGKDDFGDNQLNLEIINVELLGRCHRGVHLHRNVVTVYQTDFSCRLVIENENHELSFCLQQHKKVV